MDRIAFFTFGRYQPPTLGHGIVFQEIARLAAEAGGDAYVFVGSNREPGRNKEGGQENPLTVGEKLEIIQDISRKGLYGDKPITFVNTETCWPLREESSGCKHPFHIAQSLLDYGYTDLRLYVGVDRVQKFTSLFALKPELPVKVFFVGVDRSTGEEPSGVTTLTHISGTKIRKAARDGNRDLFEAGTGLTGDLADKYMGIISERTKVLQPEPNGTATRKRKRNITNEVGDIAKRMIANAIKRGGSRRRRRLKRKSIRKY